jgi:hypothetical protein
VLSRSAHLEVAVTEDAEGEAECSARPMAIEEADPLTSWRDGAPSAVVAGARRRIRAPTLEELDAGGRGDDW